MGANLGAVTILFLFCFPQDLSEFGAELVAYLGGLDDSLGGL
jgi:hypothetical protein